MSDVMRGQFIPQGNHQRVVSDADPMSDGFFEGVFQHVFVPGSIELLAH
jgi:hypothetical protein